jgi:putative colanic acid biosynthesis glycosyltransferase
MRFFSVITICKDNIGELKSTGKSIGEQSNNDLEWIVVDGNSKDGTKEWLNSQTTVKWISEPDKGIYDAMNKGIGMAEGRYLIFMNSGDSFAAETVLDNSLKILTENNFPVFSWGDSIDVAENGIEYYRKAKNHNKNWKGMITQHQAMFFNRLKIQNLKYSPEYFLSADYALISRILKTSAVLDILKLNYPVCRFNMGGTNEIKRFKAIKEDFRIRKDIIKLPLVLNIVLYLLHYLHSYIKKARPGTRFIRHRNIV